MSVLHISIRLLTVLASGSVCVCVCVYIFRGPYSWMYGCLSSLFQYDFWRHCVGSLFSRSLFLDVWMCVAPYFNMTLSGFYIRCYSGGRSIPAFVVVVGRVRTYPRFVVTPVAVRRRRISRWSLSLSSVVFVRVLVLWSSLLLSAGAESVCTASSCSCPRLVVTPVAVHGRRISRQASGKQSLSPVPPTIYHSGVLCRKQAVSIRPVPRASQNNSIRSLSLRDLALLSLQQAYVCMVYGGVCMYVASVVSTVSTLCGPSSLMDSDGLWWILVDSCGF